MTVFILDLDWLFDKSEIPNVECMKLSSFLKQVKAKVYFIGDLSELSMQYDKLFVFGNSDSTPTLGSKILNDPRTTLLGKRFELCGAKTLNAVIMGCRPDYLLYDIKNEKSNSYTKANFVTFYTNGGEIISTRQPWKNTKKGVKRTIVTDDMLWEQRPEEIERCLQELEGEHNIVFLNPVSLLCLIENSGVRQQFMKLHFSSGTKFKWRNNVGQDAEAAQKIVFFLKELKQHTKSDLGMIPFKAVFPQDNWNWENNFERLINVCAIFKQNKMRCFLAPEHWDSLNPVYKWINDWCLKGYKISFIENMLLFAMGAKGKRWFHIINEPQYWGDKRIKTLIRIIINPRWKNLLPQMCIQWGGDSIDPSRIDFNNIYKYSYSLI